MPSLQELEKYVPNLPGYRPSKLKEKHHKAHLLGFKDGVRVVAGNNPDIFESEPTESTQGSSSQANLITPLVEGEALRFYGYYIDDNKETQNVVVYIFHDNTVQVYEKATQNAGHFQGVIVKRQHVRTPALTFLSWINFNVACDVLIFGRPYHLTSCDAFTRDTLVRSGVSVPSNSSQPASPAATKKIVNTKIPSLAASSSHNNKTSKNFLSMDGKVLRFYCVWDDQLKYGQVHKLVLRYYLSDDTIEVREYRDNLHNTMPFMRRQKMPKKLPELSVDGRNLGADSNNYSEHDLAVGKTVNLYGRTFYLCGCDGFTREFFAHTYHQELQEDVPLGRVVGYDYETGKLKMISASSIDSFKQKELPPAPSILPSGSEQIQKKFGFTELDSLNAVAKLESSDVLDNEREFQIRFYLIDDTIAIFEKGVLNSGIKSGKFLERRLVKKPTGGPYRQQDFAPGSKLEIYGRTFVIQSLDSYSKKILKLE